LDGFFGEPVHQRGLDARKPADVLKQSRVLLRHRHCVTCESRIGQKSIEQDVEIEAGRTARAQNLPRGGVFKP
jgi:hypothetical protein